jgi:hypothetical protein
LPPESPIGGAGAEAWARTAAPGGGRRFACRVAKRAKAREWFERFPKAAYMTEIESWCELADDKIEFVIRRLPSAD